MTPATQNANLKHDAPVLSLVSYRIASLLFLGAMSAAIWERPYAVPLTILLVIHMVLQLRWPLLWLASVPALLPILDWSPWSGWLPLQEFELFILAVLAVGYWQAPYSRRGGRFGFLSGVLVTLFTASWCWSLVAGAQHAPADLPGEWGSLGAMNVWRSAKGYLLAWCLLPMVRRAWFVREKALWRYFMPGVTAGLALAAVIVVLERWLFPGLTDFASDYRAVGPFFEMFAGGAALDCFLSAMVPLSLWVVLRRRLDLTAAVGTLVLLVGTYAALTSFSRGVYLAYLLSAVLLALTLIRGARAGTRIGWSLAWLLLGGYGLLLVFQFGGYRTLAAALLAILVAMPLGPSRLVDTRRSSVVVTSLGLALLSLPIALWLPKGPYVATAATALVAIVGTIRAWRSRTDHANVLQWAGAISVSLLVPLVARYWRDDGSWWPVCAWVGYIWLTILLARLAGWWKPTPIALVIPSGLMLVLGLIIPVVGNYYMGTRFSQISHDLTGRKEHWADVLALVPGIQEVLLGSGKGRFADDYYWRNRKQESPGAFAIKHEGISFLRLIAPRYVENFGEVVRVGQRVDVVPGRTLTFSAMARSAAPEGSLELSVCEKWLLYPFNCQHAQVYNIGSEWQPISALLAGERVTDRWSWLRPNQLSLSTRNTNSSSTIDVTDMHLVDSAGNELLKNTQFERGLAYWSYTSDRHHLPWHAKNMWLHVYYEQGVTGVVLFTGLLLAALVALRDRASRGDELASLLGASLVAICAVGLFDSLLDFPRIECLIFMILWLSLMRTENRPVKPSRPTRRP
jgi:hypothetical protein